MSDLYAIAVETLDGRQTTLKEHAGKVVLIVNTASKCGYTPQFQGLEALYRRFKDRGFVVLGFPCNQFGAQDPGTGAEIGAFCQQNYGVTFPMHVKTDVNGAWAHPLFKALTHAVPGALGTEFIKWNFTKFLVDRQGRPVGRYGSRTKPESLEKAIEALL